MIIGESIYARLDIKVKIVSNDNNKKALIDFKNINKSFNTSLLRQIRTESDNELRYVANIVDFVPVNLPYMRILGMPSVYSPSLKMRIVRLLYKKGIDIELLIKIFKLGKVYNLADLCYILNLNVFILSNTISPENLYYYSYYIEFDSINKIIRHYQIPKDVFIKF